MNELREKPVYGQSNKLRQRLEYIQWALGEAQEAADLCQRRTAEAMKAMGELMDEEGDVFHRLRCQSCRTSWLDERANPSVTHCPSCGKKYV